MASDFFEAVESYVQIEEFGDAVEAIINRLKVLGVSKKDIEATLDEIAVHLLMIEIAAYKLGYEERDENKGVHPGADKIRDADSPRFEIIQGGKRE
jgi:hypothetical protein